MRVTIFGSGDVWLVTGACLADAGNHVLYVDVDAAKIERLKRGEVPLHEPGLDSLIKRGREVGGSNSRPTPPRVSSTASSS
jgi:UDPglucose 6-dehydrogenase